MQYRLASLVVIMSAGGVLATARASDPQTRPTPLVAHEWGTFTSIAGADGAAVQWLPDSGPQDLPCFVERNLFNVKNWLPGTVRMETPVLYFYSPGDVTVSVSVRFTQGTITEWYPQATVHSNPWDDPEGRITWPDVRVSRSIAPTFPVEQGRSHYYEARRTDAVPIEVGSQKERFLFYRGVGHFAPPVSATVGADGRTTAWSESGQPLGDVIVFDNHNGAIAYAEQRAAGARVTIDRPVVDDDVTALRRELARILTANGLYQKEADAMIATWNDSWFEEGARLFYIAPRAAVDAILPLRIAPAPSAIARVFVGRLELVTPATRGAVRKALEANDSGALARYGRFLQAIGDRVVAESEPSQRALLDGRLRAAASPWITRFYSCR